MLRQNRKVRQNRILWLDLEMSGLSISDDVIMEVAAIVTDWNLKEIATYHGIVKNRKTVLDKRFALSHDFWDTNQLTRDSLLNQNKVGKKLLDIQDELLVFVNENFRDDKPVLLAGNSIHIDRGFIIKNWPKFDSKLHYRMLDVSAWKVVFAGKYRNKYSKLCNHRALDDIRGSILELQYYLTKIKQ